MLVAVLAAAVVASMSGCARDPVTGRLSTAAQLLDQKKFGMARREIDAAIELQPSELSVYMNALALYAAAKRYGDQAEVGELLAERSRKSGLKEKLTPDQAAALYAMIGDAYWQAKALGPAERAYLHALRLAPNDSGLLNNLGYFYADQGIKPREAVKLTRKAVELDPENGTVLDSLGWALYRVGDYREAATTLRHAVELEPDEGELRYHLGAVYARLGRGVEARVELEKALVLDKTLSEARSILTTVRL